MQNPLRRLSPQEASKEVTSLAISFAMANGLEGQLLHVAPDDFYSETEGKTRIHWAAVFRNLHNGHEMDGPVILKVNLRDREVRWGTEA